MVCMSYVGYRAEWRELTGGEGFMVAMDVYEGKYSTTGDARSSQYVSAGDIYRDAAEIYRDSKSVRDAVAAHRARRRMLG